MEQWEQKARAVLDSLRPMWKYMAMDNNGIWHIYIDKPSISECGLMWYLNDVLKVSLISVFFDLDPAPDWKNSLLERSE